MIEWRTVDKAEWERGPWDDEPDKMQWRDEATGLPCLIVRNSDMGNLCGYVGMPPGHPWHGLDYEACAADVHGGLIFAGPCMETKGDPSRGVCHIALEGEPDDVWWLGFDCAHAFDYMGMAMPGMRLSRIPGEAYRDIPYVRRQCEQLAEQAQMAAAMA